MTITTHNAERNVEKAQSSYDSLLEMYEQVSAGKLTSSRILEQARLRKELEGAARQVQAAKAERDHLVQKEDRDRRAKAHEQLAEAEEKLVELTSRAEELADELAPVLTEIKTAGRSRYGALHTITGRAQHRLIPDSHIVGWLRYRLAGLESTDLGLAQHHQRAPLADLLGLTTPQATSTETDVDTPNQEDTE